LVDERLLVRGEEVGKEDRKATVEVAHEALIRRWARLGKWVDEDRDKLLHLDKIAEWVGERKARGALLAGGQLAYSEDAERRWGEDLGGDAKKLLAESRARATRERRARWFVLVTAVAAAVGFAVLGLWAYGEAGVARRRAQVARDAVRISAAREAG